MTGSSPVGARGGTERTFYFHGQPGSARELRLFDSMDLRSWHVLDRSIVDPQAGLSAHFDRLATEVRVAMQGKPASFVGFSLGAYVALEVAARLPDQQLAIDLVSAAAPLSTGDFLGAMAGKAVFSSARRPRIFAWVVTAQSLAARYVPDILSKMLFASAQGGDRLLYRDPHFREGIKRVIREGLGRNRNAYRAEVQGYVEDWSPILATVRHSVTIWHGRSDSWSPPAMANALAWRLPNVAHVHLLDGCSHYSTLEAYLSWVSAKTSADVTSSLPPPAPQPPPARAASAS